MEYKSSSTLETLLYNLFLLPYNFIECSYRRFVKFFYFLSVSVNIQNNRNYLHSVTIIIIFNIIIITLMIVCSPVVANVGIEAIKVNLTI